MGKIGKNISIALVWLAGLILFNHAVLPHHHHFDSLFSHQNNTECSNSQSEEQNEDSDSHCHAFNDIIFEKVNSLLVQTQNVSNYNLFYVSSKVTSGVVIESTDLFYLSFNIVPPRQYFYTNSSLRAPPSLS